MERTLQMVEARHAIETIVYGYAEAIDTGDIERVAELLPECRLVMPDGSRLQGGDAIVDRYRSIIRFYDDEGREVHYQRHQCTPRTRHINTNLQIAFTEDMTAADVRSYFSVYQALEGSMDLVAGGRYLDHFANGDDGWRMTERTILIEHTGDMSRHVRQ